MTYEVVLICVLVAGGYWGWYFTRHDATRLYGALLVASAFLSALGILGIRTGRSELGVPGAIGVGAGVCLLVVGPLARGLARRFAAAERFGIADKLLGVADVLAPGSGVGDEKALLYAMREIRDGNIDHTVDALTAAKDRAPDDARLAIDERIAMLYLASYRWDDAIHHAEQHLFDHIATEPLGEAGGSPQTALRRVLGIAPPVYVELLGAYGYKGDLDRAAAMLARLEEVCAGRPDGAMWLHRGRLMFLALAGRVDAVQALVVPRRSRHMKPAARTYWIAVAHERKGAREAAEAAYEKARARSRGRPRVLIDQALERLPNATPAQLGPTATEVIARVEAEPPPVVTARARPRGPVATRMIVTAILAWATVVSFALDNSTDVGVLMRAGAMVRGQVDGGEWWRIVTFSFVHVGGIHLIGNFIALWLVGRLVEELFGPWRTIAIFGAASIVGALASYAASTAGVAAGASGAIFGFLGALFVELAWHRRHHRASWGRALWGILAVVLVVQLGLGWVYPVVDQWAHGGGLVTGLVLGALLSPNARWSKLNLIAARVIAVAFGAAAVVATVFAARTSIADSFARAPQALHSFGTLHAVAPASWQTSSDELFDPDLFILLTAHREAPTAPFAQQLEAYTKGEPKRAKDRNFDDVETAKELRFSLPSGWQGSELVVSVADPLGGIQRYRVLVAGRPDPTGPVLVSLYAPESVVRAAPELFIQLLATLQ